MITAVIPVSPIPSHPDTAILDETVASIRHHLPDIEIMLTFDGVRLEQEGQRADYEEHIRRALWKADHDPLWRPVCPFVFDDHLHQVGMMRAILPEIRTDQLLYVEQDTPLVTDWEIEFSVISNFIKSRNANVVRLHHESVIPDEHRHMMHGTHYWNVPMVQTSQWSQRPHVAATNYYRHALDTYFSPEAKSFIEDKMHGIVSEDYLIDGLEGWARHRVHIYAPEGNIKRSYHTDGRAGAPKFETEQRF